MSYSIKLLRMNDVTRLTSLSRSTINRLEKKGLFQKRRSIGFRAVGWLESEVYFWISESNQRLHGESKEQAIRNNGVIKSKTHRATSGGV